MTEREREGRVKNKMTERGDEGQKGVKERWKWQKERVWKEGGRRAWLFSG